MGEEKAWPNVAISIPDRKYPAEYVFLLNNDARAGKEADAGIVGVIIKDEQSGEMRSSGGRYNPKEAQADED